MRQLLSFKKYFLSIIVVVFFIVASSCKKNDEVLPEITTVSQPAVGATYYIPSTVPVSFTANDNSNISFVRLRLVNTAFANVQSDITYTINQKSSTFSYDYSLTDIHLKSGAYYIQITVGDGNNETSKFIPIYIVEFPRYSLGVAVAMKDVAGTSTIIGKVDTIGNYSQLQSINGKCAGFQLSNYEQDIVFASSDKDILKAIDINTEVITWAKYASVSSSIYYGGLWVNDAERLSFASSFNDAQVIGYDKDGSKKYAISAPTDHYPLKMTKVGDYLLVETKDKITSVKKLATYVYATKLLANEYNNTGKDVVEMFSLDNSKVIIFSNTNTNPALDIFDINTNSIFSPNTLPNSKLLSVTRVDGKNFILAFENGDLYKYYYDTNTLYNFLSSKKAYALAYDSIRNSILVADAKTILWLDNATYAQQSNVVLTDTIISLQTWYNK